MTFRENDIEGFKSMIKANSVRIRAFEGCEHLQILQDKDRPHIVFTYSHWRDEAALEAYRRSELFAEIWPKARARFAQPAEAWTVEPFVDLP